MKYRPYPEYLHSEVEWLDSVPCHWGSVKMRWLVQLYVGGTPTKNIEAYWDEGTVPWINSGAVNQINVTEPSMYMTEQAYKNSSAKWIPKNALVMALAGQGKTKGMVAKLAIDTTFNQSIAAIVPNKLCDSDYLFWWLTCNYQNIRNMAGGDIRDGLSLELLGNIECPIPTNSEKKAIAKFLDHETAKIDALIGKQQRLIELLKEKAQALIIQAVTKGLNPHVTLKDSGIEWLGKIPVHWKIAKSGFYISIRSGFTFPSCGFSNDEHATKLLRGINVGISSMKWEDTVYWQRSANDGLEVYEVAENDIVIGMDRPLINNGVRVAKIQSNDLPCLLVQRVASLKTKASLNSDYLLHILSSALFIAHFFPDTTGISVPHISSEQISNFIIPLPTVEEQKAITKFLDAETLKLDSLIGKAYKMIDLLKERRIALISAVVTGKIDVRDFV